MDCMSLDQDDLGDLPVILGMVAIFWIIWEIVRVFVLDARD